MTCGGGESVEGNEILLCDGLACANNYHQQCCNPPVPSVPEGAWLCPTCVANGNVVDPQARSRSAPRTALGLGRLQCTAHRVRLGPTAMYRAPR